ncbi:hypothetical protein BSKO_11393 [Bryopsis sp. KO-2023]|nr:hypothetical protein BSKO_11393 [Bryopsis sp. KO-2023]
MAARFVISLTLVAAVCLHAVVASGKGQNVVWQATPAFKVVQASPATAFTVPSGTHPKVETVRKVVQGSDSGCSITACSQVTDGCGWCEKDGGFAVGYTKDVQDLSDKTRTTLTLAKECKGKQNKQKNSILANTIASS